MGYLSLKFREKNWTLMIVEGGQKDFFQMRNRLSHEGESGPDKRWEREKKKGSELDRHEGKWVLAQARRGQMKTT